MHNYELMSALLRAYDYTHVSPCSAECMQACQANAKLQGYHPSILLSSHLNDVVVTKPLLDLTGDELAQGIAIA